MKERFVKIKNKITDFLGGFDGFTKCTISAFVIVLFLISFTGLLFFLRPSESELEKRKLTKFPKFTVASFLDGSFTSDISTWYADTFPMRDTLIKANTKLASAKGIKDEEVIGSLPGKDDKKKKDDASDGNDFDNDPGERVGALYVVDGAAFEIFGFDEENFTNYYNAINHAANSVAGQAHTYSILVPNSCGIMLTEKKQKEVGSDSQKEACLFVKNGLNDNVTFIDLYDTLLEHKDEYIYFRTDHHWTSDGAYYAYEDLMKATGQKIFSKSDLKKLEFPGFLGTFYAYSNQNQDMADNPDTVAAYVPSPNEMETIYEPGDETINYPVVMDATDYDSENKYLTFLGGDKALCTINNPEAPDTNRKCLVVKESYGNCFVPFLVNDFSTVYVVDFRYSKENLTDFVYNNGITDVIFINSTVSVNKEHIKYINELWQ